MLRLLALLAIFALLFQAAGPALAAPSGDCHCMESGCNADASLPCGDSGTTCPMGQCGRSLPTLAQAWHPDAAARQGWGALPLPLPTDYPPDSDLRPPIG